MIGGKEIRKSLKTKNWQRAQKKVRDMEIADKEPDERITIEHACEAFLEDAKARGLRNSSLERYDPLFTRLKEFAASMGLRYMNQLDLNSLREFRAGWEAQNYGARNELERLRALFRFAHDADWIPDNPARKLKAPRIAPAPTLPFSKDDMKNILSACDAAEAKGSRHRPNNVLPMKAFILLSRYSGLRIRDVVTLSRDKIHEGRLFLRTAKTGTAVKLPLPPVCLEALATIPARNQYYFWSGQGLPKTRVTNYQYALKKVFAKANVAGGHHHRFRDTFAVELLLAGTPIERVAILLGHSSTKVTQAHYNPWIQARQDQLEEDVIKTW
ncbi:MAG TPA: tyrosine-type recombinase/integrase [Candidatus Saccharimonadales bacterium]|nr:tyrosine-type recombinase/integrase [Candidatus Saccharimonadales bacterium]